MSIRIMRPSDYESVYQLWTSCRGMGLNDLDDSKESIEKFLNRNPETCFVAEEGQSVIGAVIAGNDGRRGYIYHAAVSPAHRRRGVATKLIDSVISAFGRLGVNKVALVVFSANADGNAFWEKIGFSSREDLVYRNRAIAEMTRTDT